MYFLCQYYFSILIHLFIRPPNISHNSSNESKWKNNQSPGALFTVGDPTHFHSSIFIRSVNIKYTGVYWKVAQWSRGSVYKLCVCVCGKLCNPTFTFLILRLVSLTCHTHTPELKFLISQCPFLKWNKKSDQRIFHCCFCLQVGKDDSQ